MKFEILVWLLGGDPPQDETGPDEDIASTVPDSASPQGTENTLILSMLSGARSESTTGKPTEKVVEGKHERDRLPVRIEAPSPTAESIDVPIPAPPPVAQTSPEPNIQETYTRIEPVARTATPTEIPDPPAVQGR
jgi:hypothetical protein